MREAGILFAVVAGIGHGVISQQLDLLRDNLHFMAKELLTNGLHLPTALAANPLFFRDFQKDFLLGKVIQHFGLGAFLLTLMGRNENGIRIGLLGLVILLFFNEAEKEQDHKAEEPTVETFTVAAHSRKKKRTLAEMTENLPEKEILLELPEDQRICGKCGGMFKPIGKKFVRHELQVIPRQVKLLAYYTVTYACDHCEKDIGFAHIANVKPPVPLMKHSMASPSSVADIMAKKYADGLPLARQEKIWAREGVELSRATMSNWVIQCAQTWLKPLYKHMKQHLLEQSVIHADETVVQVLKEDGQPVTSESRMWVYASGERSTTPIRIFEYQPDRSGKRPESYLRGFTGCLVTDGYAGYNQVAKVTHCGCWTHMKRK